jgi:hypothetical protein
MDGTDKNKLKLAETSFKTVLDANVHEDNKASRILAAMAFLTAAAAAVFARAQSITTPQPIVFGLAWAVASFSFYMFLVLLGSLFYLVALGPALNLPRSGKSGIQSLLFFQKIAEVATDQWEKHWKEKTAVQLEEEMTGNFVSEAYLIAEKARAKVTWMSIGSLFFRGAFLPLAALVIGLYPLNSQGVWFYARVAAAVFVLTQAIAVYIRPGLERRTKFVFLVALILVAAALIWGHLIWP